MHYVVNNLTAYDGAPNLDATVGLLTLPDGQTLEEGIGWTKIVVLPGNPSLARQQLSERSRHRPTDDQQRRKRLHGGAMS